MGADSDEPNAIHNKKLSTNGFGQTKIDIEPDSIEALDQENGTKLKEKKKTKKGGGEEEQEDEYKKKNDLPPVPMSELFKYATGFEKFLMLLGTLAAMVSGVCMPLMFVLFGNVTNAFVYNGMIQEINNNTMSQFIQEYEQYEIYENYTVDEFKDVLREEYGVGDFITEVARFGIGTIVIGAVQMLLGYVFVTSMNYAAEGQVYRLRGMFLQSILKQEIGWFDTHQTNDFASRVTEDMNKLQEGIGEKIGMFIFFMTIFLASIINAFIHGWLLTLIILSVFPLLGISTGITANIQSRLSTEETKEYAKAGSVAEEVISAIRTVVAFGGEAKELERYDSNLVHARNAGVKRGMVTGLGMGLIWLFIYAAYALAFYYGTKLILDARSDGSQSFDPADLIIVFFSVLMGAMNVGQSAPYVEAFNVARGAASVIFNIVDRSSEIDPTSSAGKKLNGIEGTIEFRDVEFKYPARPDVPILQRASFRVEPGQTVALVGSSGCGKSTCIQLMQRFYDPIAGNVLFDQEDIHNLNVGWLRDQIGIVGQEPVLFATSIEDNIRYGRPDASIDEIHAAAKEANAHDFIMKLPEKYKTNVGERGGQMSGGQKQRIAIARALVKRPKILLLDEATSALDNKSEAIVQQALDKVRKGRTTVIVAHRLSTIRTADKIVVFDKGQIAEEGTHDELMKLQNLYYNLVTAQISPLSPQIKESNEDSVSVKQQNMDENEEETDYTQEMMNNVANMSPATFTRSSSLRQSSARRRRSSTARSTKSIVKEEEEKFKEVPMSKILKLNSSEWYYIIGGILGAAIQGTTVPLYAVMFGEVFGTLSIADANEAQNEANRYAIYFLLIGIVAAAAMFFQSYMFSLSGEILTSRLRKLAFGAMLRQEMGFFDEEKNSVGALCSRLSGDASAVQGATGSRIGTIIQAITTLGISIGLALYYDWRLGLVTFPFIPGVLIAVYLQGKLLMGQSLTESKILEEAGKIAIEAITNIRTIASLHKERHFVHLYSTGMLEPHKDALKKSHLRGATFGFAQAMPFFAYGAVMWYGGSLVDRGEIDYETVFKAAEALILGTMMVGQAVAFAPNYSKAKVSASRIFALLERKPAIDTSVGTGLRLSGPVEKVELRSVHFSYPTRPDTSILSGLNVEVDKGKTLALVGSSGCGKSTIIGLLERFYDANSGHVTINNQDVQGLNVGWVRSQLGLVSQEPVLFDLSIGENIAYGDNSRTVGELEIIAAAKQANIHSFIDSLPNKYNTRVGSKGTQLSGGQKQRIAIARALLRNPSVLLLDEATSALDSESEKVVQEALERAQEGRTSIVIAHRLSTIQGADIIAVVQNGTVVESGTHEELIKKRGPYYSLYETNR